MRKINCWEAKKCGQGPAAIETGGTGCCAAAELRTNGLHGGRNGGRVCWAVAGTSCDGRVQGLFAQKAGGCLRCDFFARVQQEEGPRLLNVQEIHRHLKANCWEINQCGREPGGAKASELGVCPAALEARTDGLHGGRNGGRVCWAVAGTLCGGRVQGLFAQKVGGCLRCDFFAQVQEEEKDQLLSVSEIHCAM